MNIPEGWKLVPVEPTEEMREAYYACVPDRTGPVHAATQKWRVMLAAAPTPLVCKMCNGHGLIGGFVRAEEGYHSESCPDCNTPAPEVDRIPVDEALEIVESYGPYGNDINESLRMQIVLADEVKRLRGIYLSAVKGRADFRAAYREAIAAAPTSQAPEVEPFGFFAEKMLSASISTSKLLRPRQWPSDVTLLETMRREGKYEITPLYTHPADTPRTREDVL